MSWLTRIFTGTEGKATGTEPDAASAPKPPETPAAPAWTPGPEPTDLQAERQALLALLPKEGDDSEAREYYADWLERNGWAEDAERLRAELEQEKHWKAYFEKSSQVAALKSKPWRVQVGGEALDVTVNAWDKGLPSAITLTWEQLDRFGEELLKYAPIGQVFLSDRPSYSSAQTSGGMTVTVMGARGTITGTSYSIDGALMDALAKRFGVKVYMGNYYGGYSGMLASGGVFTGSFGSGTLMSMQIGSGVVLSGSIASGQIGSLLPTSTTNNGLSPVVTAALGS